MRPLREFRKLRFRAKKKSRSVVLKRTLRSVLLLFALHVCATCTKIMQPSWARGSSTFSSQVLSSSDLRLAWETQKEYGLIFLMYVDTGFISMTRNWLCHTPTNVIKHTHFIVSDSQVRTALKSFGARNFVVLRQLRSSLGSQYGQKTYYETIALRGRVVNQLLHHGIRIWIVESDSIWFGDPSPVLHRFHNQDVIAGQDGDGLLDRYPEGGFLFLNSTVKARALSDALLSWQIEVLRYMHESEVGDAGNEMLQLPRLLAQLNCSWSFFPESLFVSGRWYSSETLRSQTTPLVIQNNWLVGVQPKVERAKLWGHWHLTFNETKCTL